MLGVRCPPPSPSPPPQHHNKHFKHTHTHTHTAIKSALYRYCLSALYSLGNLFAAQQRRRLAGSAALYICIFIYASFVCACVPHTKNNITYCGSTSHQPPHNISVNQSRLIQLVFSVKSLLIWHVAPRNDLRLFNICIYMGAFSHIVNTSRRGRSITWSALFAGIHSVCVCTSETARYAHMPRAWNIINHPIDGRVHISPRDAFVQTPRRQAPHHWDARTRE